VEKNTSEKWQQYEDASPQAYEHESTSKTKSFHVHKIVGEYYVMRMTKILLAWKNILSCVHG
jgi:hypothetical protein